MNRYIRQFACISGFSACILVLLNSCRDKIQVDIQQKQKVIVVDAFINNLRQNQVVKLSYSDNYFSGQIPPPLSGAAIVVNDLTSGMGYTFSDNGDGNYTYVLGTADTVVHEGHKYEFVLKYKNYEYRSLTTARRTATIDSAYLVYNEVNSNGITKNGYKLNIKAKDPVGTDPDFYWIKIYKNNAFYGLITQMQLISFGNANEQDGYSFYSDIWRTMADPENVTSIDYLHSGDLARVEINGINKDAYDFFSKGIANALSSGGLFAVTPANESTNIVSQGTGNPKSTGIFCVSMASTASVVVP